MNLHCGLMNREDNNFCNQRHDYKTHYFPYCLVGPEPYVVPEASVLEIVGKMVEKNQILFRIVLHSSHRNTRPLYRIWYIRYLLDTERRSVSLWGRIYDRRDFAHFEIQDDESFSRLDRVLALTRDISFIRKQDLFFSKNHAPMCRW